MIDLGIALLCPGTGLIIPDDRVPVEVERPGSPTSEVKKTSLVKNPSGVKNQLEICCKAEPT